MLPSLSKGTHNATVYYGWQYLGIPENPSLQRYEVFAHSTVEFLVVGANTINGEDTTNGEDFVPAIVLSGVIVVVVVVGLSVYFKKRHK